MIRVSTLLKEETLEKVQKEAAEKSISVAAIIRQKVELQIRIDEIDRDLRQYDK